MAATLKPLEADSTEWSTYKDKAGPLFKWAGGKQRFLWEHREVFPTFDGTYYEPFAGGLSVFFHLAARSDAPMRARLSDLNLRLIRTYQAVKRDWLRVSDELRQLEAAYNAAGDKAAFYFRVRADHNARAPEADPARFIFLMRAGWNGVFRINQKGDFNVPHGFLKETISLPTEEDLKAIAVVFSLAELRANSWDSSISDAKRGDFVFFDPPYYTEARTQLYETNRAFTFEHHRRLADQLVRLASRGVEFVLTNSAHPSLVDLYAERGLAVREIDMHRSISSKTLERGTDRELIVTAGKGRSTIVAEAELDLSVRIAKRNGTTL